MNKPITFQNSISNEEAALLPAIEFRGPIVVVDSEPRLREACRYLAAQPVIGFDTETRPSFRAGVVNRVALLQLSSPEQSTCSGSARFLSTKPSSKSSKTRRS